jgi:glycosyltransferase involved in cell wall biosynthesis
MSRSLRILQIAPRIPWPPNDGGSIGIYNITRSLARRGHRIVFATFGTAATNPGELGEYCEPLIIRHDTRTRPRTLLGNLFSDLPYTISKYQHDAMAEELRARCRKERFDIVHVDHVHMAPYGAMLKKEFGLPYVLREHNFETTIYQRFGESQKLALLRSYMRMQTARLHRFETGQLDQADVCAAITEQDAERIRAVSQCVMQIIPAGVDLQKHKVLDRSREATDRLCILGSQAWEPNQDAVRWFLDEIWPRILAARPEARLTIAGEKPPAWLKARENQQVRIPGFVDDLAALLTESTVLCVPLRIGGGMRVKLLEYFAAGKAVVSTRVGAEGNLARHGEEIMLADGAAEFADTVLALLGDEARRRSLGDAARQLAEDRYSWEAVAVQFEEAYDLALRGRENA